MRKGESRSTAPLFELVEGLWPVGFEQPGQRSIGQQAAVGLAARAPVDPIVPIAPHPVCCEYIVGYVA